MIKISIIVPTYNEAKNLEPLTEEIFNSIDKNEIDLELIFVDDNSPDGTGQIAEGLKEKYPVQVIHRAGKMGLGSAVIAGFRFSDRPYLGVMDADMGHDPVILDSLIKSLKDYDVTMGSRFAEGSTVEKWAWWRRLTSEAGVFITRIITGVKDPLSGYFFFNRRVIDGVELNTVGYKILLEILVKGKFNKVKEMSYTFRSRKFEQSKLNAMEYYLFLKQIIMYGGLKIFKKLDDNIWLILLFVAALALLLFHSTTRTLWMDETAALLYLNSNPLTYFWNYFLTPDNHPPIYYFLVNVTYHIFPIGILGVRLLSIICGLLILIVSYIWSKEVFKKQPWPVLTVGLIMLSSYFILIAQMARYHSLAALLTLLALYFFYQVVFGGYKKKGLILFVVLSALVGWTDYPHFFYLVIATNLYYFWRWFRQDRFISLMAWIKSQAVIFVTFLPMLWLIFHRVFVQGDGGFGKVDIFGRGPLTFLLNLSMHFYAFFFGENVLPWNYLIFALGVLVMLVLAFYGVKSIKEELLTKEQWFFLLFSLFFIILNTFILNILDPRYNFIVYPKYVFVAFPLFVISLAIIISKINKPSIRRGVILAIFIVEVFGLINFYSAKNYLNASYFNNFSGFEWINNKAQSGDYLIISGDANRGVYDFYKDKYFSVVTPIELDKIDSSFLSKPEKRLWFFATASDDSNVNNETDSKIPTGLKILDRRDSVPLDSNLKQAKEKILNRGSYTYKYTVFLLTN